MDCKRYVKGPSMLRCQSPFYKGTLETFVCLSSTEICVCKLRNTRLNSASNSCVRCFEFILHTTHNVRSWKKAVFKALLSLHGEFLEITLSVFLSLEVGFKSNQIYICLKNLWITYSKNVNVAWDGRGWVGIDTKNRIYKTNIKMVVLSLAELLVCIKFNNPNGYQIIRFTEKSQYIEEINPYFVHRYRLVPQSSPSKMGKWIFIGNLSSYWTKMLQKYCQK